MPFDDILACTWQADVHGVDCTRKAFEAGRLTRTPDHPHADPGEDREALPYGLAHREGDLIHPILRLAAERRERCRPGRSGSTTAGPARCSPRRACGSRR